jgi:LuxR family maltose regulon positive regulatory protein
MAEPEGYLRIFIDEGEPIRKMLNQVQGSAYARKLLELMPEVGPTNEQAIQSSNLVEPLTERELEVLHLLAGGLTYAQVADHLVVSVNTVRYHIKGIYGKLGVEKQVHAVERGRELGLLPKN